MIKIDKVDKLKVIQYERLTTVVLNCFPDSAEEVRHDEGEYDCLLEERLGRLQPRDVLPPHARVVADDLARDLWLLFISINHCICSTIRLP